MTDNKDKRFKIWNLFSVEDFREYYDTNFTGDMIRSQIKREDRSFYGAVERRGLQNEVLPESIYRDWTGFEVEDFIDYYNEHYSGMIRSQIKREDRGFYEAIIKRRLQDQVFPGDQREGKWTEFEVEDFIDYCEYHHEGKNRSEIKKTDRSFYEVVIKRRLQDEVFPKNKSGRNRVEFGLENSIEYYHDHYTNKSRKKVSKADVGFYE